MKIGAVSDAFRMPVRDNLRNCRALGVTGAQIFVGLETEVNPSMSAAHRRDFGAFCQSLGLDLTAMFISYSGHGLENASENPEKLRFTKTVVDLAADLGCPVVASHFGIIPDNPRADAYLGLHDACREIGPYAQERGIKYCIETGPETAQMLKRFLEDTAAPGIGVNFDPANLAMVMLDDPVKGVYLLQDYIFHTHAKDGVQIMPATAMDIYRPSEEAKKKGPLYAVKPLGEGAVDWGAYLGALRAIGYDGYLTIEPEGNPPEEYVQHAVAFLSEKLDVKRA